MLGRVFDDVTVGVHYLAMAYIVFGGFVVWRWRRTLLVHAAAIVWAVISLSTPVTCPLTWLENYFRRVGGLPQLKGGFIDTYLTGVLYPGNDVLLVQIIVGLIVIVSWIGIYLRSPRRGQRGRMDHATPA
jgi:prepilin signal peptidase PulO-like enzyme (type II secretory pathway)